LICASSKVSPSILADPSRAPAASHGPALPPGRRRGNPLPPLWGLTPAPRRRAPARGVDVKPSPGDPRRGPKRAQKGPKPPKRGYYPLFSHFWRFWPKMAIFPIFSAKSPGSYRAKIRPNAQNRAFSLKGG